MHRSTSPRARADAELGDQIRAIHDRSRGTYGAPRVHAKLTAHDVRVGRWRIARLMRAMPSMGACRRKWVPTTKRDRDARPAPDPVERNITVEERDQLWIADSPYIPTWARFLHPAVVVDAWSRRVVGRAMATHLRRELMLDALDMALARRRPRDVIHHSDQGRQYTSVALGMRCREAGIRPSMGSVGDPYDNAMCESCLAPLECEMLARRRYKNQKEARMGVFEFVDGWYNPHRWHSSLGYPSR